MALTAQQIVTKAVSIAKVTTGMAPIAGQYLNSVLAELCMTYDFDLNRKTATVNLTGTGANNGIGPYNLPADYLRGCSRDLTYQIGTVPFVLVQYDLAEFDMFINTTGVANHPSAYVTDISPMSANPRGVPTISVYPPPVSNI